MGSNIKRLGNVMADRMQSTAKRNIPTTLELGTINSDLSLTTDGLRGNISPKEYMVDLILTHVNYETSETTHIHEDGEHEGHMAGDGTHIHNGGEHVHRSPIVLRRLQPGDRVLVAWVGFEPIVIAIVVPGETITG